MADNDWTALFSGSGGVPASGHALRDGLLRNAPLIIPTAGEVTTTLLTGARALVVAGASFFYDAADTVSAHDGVAVLVSLDGRRYKLGKPQFVPNRVESYTNTPPGSPALGAAYLVGLAPSGAWAAHADDVAVYTVNGWAFINPDNIAGLILYVADEDSSYQFADSGWRKGLGASAVGDGSIRPNHLASSLPRIFSVENQTTSAPPVSPVDGSSYIIGPSPTGSWAGHGGKIAVFQDAGWAIFPPVEGWRVWDKALDAEYVFNGLAWISPILAQIAVPRIGTAFISNAGALGVAGASNSSGAAFQYVYSDGVAPTTSARRIIYDFLDISFAATAAGRKLVFEWDGVDLATFDQSFYTVTIAIFRDSEANAIAWCNPNLFKSRLMALSADGLSHVYRLAVTCIEPLGGVKPHLKNMSFSVMEVSA